MRRQGAGAQALLVTTAMQLRTHAGAGPEADEQRTDALGAIHLVG